MNDDAELLRAYVESGSEAAFAALVERHKGLVYASALRQTGAPALAEEITQTVFIALARKAATLKPGTLLSGWLFRAARFAASDALKSEHRRVRREHEASLMNPNDNNLSAEEAAAWEEIAPVLDESLARLGEADRHALLLRFFEQRKLADVGQALGMSEDSARKRVDRAMEKLRGILGRRGVVVPAALLTTVLAANAAPSAPATLTISAAATTPLLKGTLALMAWSKTKIAVIAIASLLLATGGALIVANVVQNPRNLLARTPDWPPTGDNWSLPIFSVSTSNGLYQTSQKSWSIKGGRAFMNVRIKDDDSFELRFAYPFDGDLLPKDTVTMVRLRWGEPAVAKIAGELNITPEQLAALKAVSPATDIPVPTPEKERLHTLFQNYLTAVDRMAAEKTLVEAVTEIDKNYYERTRERIDSIANNVRGIFNDDQLVALSGRFSFGRQMVNQPVGN